MPDNKKEQEREELHRAIWAIADDLRGSVDGWDFKSYVLGIMFYRYISENLTNYINADEIAAGNADFDYAKLSDEEAEQARDDLVQTKGFFILPSELFVNVRARAPQDDNLNMTMEAVFRHIEDSAKGTESEDDFAGLFDDIDVNSNKLGATVAKRNAMLVKLLDGIGAMKLGEYKENTIDAFGDAYEYLMSMYASNAGKSGGEFFTPQEVSELLTRLAVVGKTEVNKVYDPACGSGSLLLKAAKILGKENVRQGFFGQEINLTTYNLCRINMFLHDIDFDKFNIAHEDHLFFETLSGLGGKESEVLNFLVCAMRNSDNTYTGPMKKIAENVNCSKATVQRAMDTLTDKGFVAMEFDCVWRINPSMVIKGNRNKEKVLMDEFLATQKEYDKKRKARKNGKKQKTVKG